ncbi:DNA damage-inducible protein 1 [Neolecta irregularis DAH-3]|uniref:DNA damage-inducible protein 1 n=1 Tax=Neolecta irregularis (strain DAH-3) TaxID=1198029 RepID=A0A1U7LNT4_NEOID|nr:DNA damage-inducible protein 1 [Neolecta irregularis DAH-3]|eukprot:OLL24326.1 DNA damage-inducible protein 1 [Neolecta irregularis DAH-3]
MSQNTKPIDDSAFMDAETIRLQILAQPDLLAQLQLSQPELADAALNDPPRFILLIESLQERARADRNRESSILEQDPLNSQTQIRIEQAIRQDQIMENLQNAMEYHPESFGRVVMLYVPIEVNGHKVGEQI